MNQNRLKSVFSSLTLITLTLSFGSWAAKRPVIEESAIDLETCVLGVIEKKIHQRGFETVTEITAKINRKNSTMRIANLDLYEVFKQGNKPTILHFDFTAHLPEDGIRTHGQIAIKATQHPNRVDCMMSDVTLYMDLRSFVMINQKNQREVD